MGLKPDAERDACLVIVVFVTDGFRNHIKRGILRVEITVKQGRIFGEFVQIGGVTVECAEIQTESGGNRLQLEQVLLVLVRAGIARVTAPQAEQAVISSFVPGPSAES